MRCTIPESSFCFCSFIVYRMGQEKMGIFLLNSKMKEILLAL